MGPEGSSSPTSGPHLKADDLVVFVLKPVFFLIKRNKSHDTKKENSTAVCKGYYG